MASKFNITTEGTTTVHHADGTKTVDGVHVPAEALTDTEVEDNRYRAALAEAVGAQDCTCWMTSRNGCPRHYVR